MTSNSLSLKPSHTFDSASTTPGRPCICALAISAAAPCRLTALAASSHAAAPPLAATIDARIASEPNRTAALAWNSSAVMRLDASATCFIIDSTPTKLPFAS